MKHQKVLRCVAAPPCFSSIFTKGTNFVASCLPLWIVYSFRAGPGLDGKNLL